MNVSILLMFMCQTKNGKIFNKDAHACLLLLMMMEDPRHQEQEYYSTSATTGKTLEIYQSRETRTNGKSCEYIVPSTSLL